MWTQTHADWWTDHQGNSIHRVEIEDDDAPAQRYYCHRAGERLPWSGEAETLGEAQAQIEQQEAMA